MSKVDDNLGYESVKHRGGKGGRGDKLQLPPGDDDRNILLWILDTIEDELRGFVFERQRFFPLDRAQNFQRLWEEVKNRFVEARATLIGLRRASFKSNGKLAKAGLTGEMLILKASMLRDCVNSIRDFFATAENYSITNPEVLPGALLARGRGTKDVVFGVINSLLGSLAKAFPGLEGVKEYKEHLEHGIKLRELANEP